MPIPASKDPQTLFDHSQYCWTPALGPGRNQFVSFELRVFVSTACAGPLQLHLFADSRYRLWVNETFVAYGPARFVTAHPEYDSHDLAPRLRVGSNLIRVEVNFYGCSSFQTLPDGSPGFIAAGGSPRDGIDFSTPGQWVTRVHRAWEANAPHFSFAQNPAEICDTRRLAEELASSSTTPAATVPPEASPWPQPFPRSAPYPDYAAVSPVRILTCGHLRSALRWGQQLMRSGPVLAGEERTTCSVAFATWIHSPLEQSVDLEIFWACAQLNGSELDIHYPGRLGNHGSTLVTLGGGWNFLTGWTELLLEHWPFLLGLPSGSGCTLHAQPDRECTEAFALSPPSECPVVPPPPGRTDEYRVPFDWLVVPSDLASVTPARLVAWDSPEPATVVKNVPFAALSEVIPQTASAALWTFDFADEFYGQPVIEVEAPAGTLLDLAYDDWIRADGCVNLFHSNPFTDAADRFVLRGGRQRIEVLNPRGGIFLQVVLRAPCGSPPVALMVHDLAIRRRTTLLCREGSFESTDPLLNWIWHVSTHTLQASADEAYADCPWRERGSYIGDSFVNFHLHRLISADLSVARRTIDLFGRCQLPSGQLQACAPSWLNRPHEDFTLIWVLTVHDYWAYTGDAAFVAGQLPVIRRIFTSPTWHGDSDGLWGAVGSHLFIDWGVLPSEREGSANTVLNLLRVAALRAAGALFEAAGLPAEAAAYRAEAARVASALMRRVWDETAGRFLASAGASTPAVHANVLALRFGIGPADRILRYLEPHLAQNFRRGLAGGQFSGFLEFYFFHFLLPALVAHDRVALAETLIAETYGHLRSLGFPTLTECFHRAAEGRGSCCHSWSGAAAIYAMDQVLGLRLAKPGDPDTYLLDPVPSGRNCVSGALPHRHGRITVSWQRQPDGRILAQIDCPAQVTLVGGSRVEIVHSLIS